MSNLKDKLTKEKVKSFLADNLVAELFIALTIVSIPISGFSAQLIIDDILTRIGRNAFLVFSLVLPIMAGMGINFGMVLAQGNIDDALQNPKVIEAYIGRKDEGEE